MVVRPNAPPLTVEEYKNLPETGPRYQLIEGDLYLAPAPKSISSRYLAEARFGEQEASVCSPWRERTLDHRSGARHYRDLPFRTERSGANRKIIPVGYADHAAAAGLFDARCRGFSSPLT
jgi:hypothetical protein